MSDPIIGRNREIKILKEILSSNKSEFVTVHCRRRVGKTYLIKSFMKKNSVIFFRVTGMNDTSFKK
jgi:AAA+ ATPase superfamily predicted ATPase